ncbi:hypothetical protein AJ80_09775 [Polytolypa hystricis UAMH7299]|uniref:Uncharacterized protein n=1 Tax=Polytolypa hystricis (strain UAMH7299) TaxID=1447883 RepID=A0A2B7WK07_POLH7|nr:hypothetical protein AJ80_09775 [Polytolypa hystricis UAMH7299]
MSTISTMSATPTPTTFPPCCTRSPKSADVSVYLDFTRVFSQRPPHIEHGLISTLEVRCEKKRALERAEDKKTCEDERAADAQAHTDQRAADAKALAELQVGNTALSKRLEAIEQKYANRPEGPARN